MRAPDLAVWPSKRGTGGLAPFQKEENGELLGGKQAGGAKKLPSRRKGKDS